MRNCIVTLLLWGLFLACGVAAAQEAPALTPKSPIPLANVKGRIDHLGVDVQGHRLFVSANSNHTLEVIDLQAGRQVHTIPDMASPQGAFYDASTNRLFVTSGGDGTMKIFDGSTFQLLQTVKFSSDADNIRYDARSKRVVVGYGGEKFLADKVTRAGGDGALAFLDSTGKKTGEIPMDAHPESFQLEKTGTRVFVNVPDRQEIEVADAVKGAVLARWPVTGCADNFPMALDEAHHRLFVGCRNPGSLAVFNTETGKIVALNNTVAATDDLFFDAGKGRIYVIGQGFIDAWQQKDPDHYDRIGRYATSGGDPAHTGLFVPELGELFKAVPPKGQQGAEILVYETK